jgi:predicted O-methyltransferase YrrM
MNNLEREYLTKQMKNIPQDGIVVEIGSWTGTSSVALSEGIKKYCPNAKLFCVDIFSQEYYATVPGLEMGTKINIREAFEKRMKPYPHVTIQDESLKAVLQFKDESIDFVFIDSNHKYDYVKEDIGAWFPKVKKGSIMCGHDYCSEYQGVIRAVTELLPVHTNPVRHIWESIKP